jgi:hypothetical protein
MTKVNESIFSPDQKLKVTLVGFNPEDGLGKVTIEELSNERGWYYIAIRYGDNGETRIDYKTYDVNKPSEVPFRTNRNDQINEIEILSIDAPAF